MFTFQDAIDHIVDYVGGNASDQLQRDAKRAAIDALRDLANAHRWSYHYSEGRIFTSAPQTTGTVQYDHTGGTYERQLTLTGGTWPDWVRYGQIRIGNDPASVAGGPVYEVEQQISASIITLDEVLNPGSDISSGTSYTLFRNEYLLPEDFIAQDEGLYQDNFCDMRFIHPRWWKRDERYIYTLGPPRFFTIIGDRSQQGRMACRIFPASEAAKTIDFIYQRRPGNLRIANFSEGSASVASGSRTLTGTSGTFKSSMVKCSIRLSTDGTAPTNAYGENPYDWETQIIGFTDESTLVLSDAAPSTYTGVAYVISSVIDIEEGAMLTAYKRGLEKQISIGRTLKDKPSAANAYQSALGLAKDSDSRSFANRKAGDQHVFVRRLIDMPISFADET